MVYQLFAQEYPSPQGTAGSPISLIFMILTIIVVLYLPLHFFLLRPRRRRKQGKGSPLGRLKLVSVFIFLIAAPYIIAGLGILIQQIGFIGIYYITSGVIFITLGIYVRKKSILALWCVDGMFILIVIGQFIINKLSGGVPQASEISGQPIILLFIGGIIGIGIITGILNEGFVAIRDLKKEEAKEIMESGQ